MEVLALLTPLEKTTHVVATNISQDGIANNALMPARIRWQQATATVLSDDIFITLQGKRVRSSRIRVNKYFRHRFHIFLLLISELFVFLLKLTQQGVIILFIKNMIYQHL